MSNSTVNAPPADVWLIAADGFFAWRQGSQEGLDSLVRVMTPVLWHTVRAYGLDEALAQDVVQSTWLALLRRSETIQDPQAVGAWLTVTARREAWRVARRAQRDEPTEDEHLARHVPAAASVEATVIERAEQERLWRAVHQLSERCQRLLRVVAFAARPHYAELAADLDMPVGSIGPTRRRCLERLRVELTRKDPQ